MRLVCARPPPGRSQAGRRDQAHLRWTLRVLPSLDRCSRILQMKTLVTITGPIAAGKNTTADALAACCIRAGRTVVVADVDDVAAMVGGAGAGAVGLWPAAHEAHGALVAQWMCSEADLVIGVGPIYCEVERAALFGRLPAGARVIRVLIDAPLAVTGARVQADRSRGLSRQPVFHESAHARFHILRPEIPTDLTFDSAGTSSTEIAAQIYDAVGWPG